MDDKVMILDEYDCSVMFDRLRVAIDGIRDPSLADIMSEIHHSDGHIYFDGSYYIYANKYDISPCESGWCLDLFIEYGEGYGT